MKKQIQNEVAIAVTNLTKSFKVPTEPTDRLKNQIIGMFRKNKGYRTFTPLKNISFEIKKGEFFGIVGRNGSGKSTLLKSIAGIYTPNHGSVEVNGSLVPFIELGVGFNPELSGRENVYLNGALLGFSRSEIDAIYDEIVDFAELRDFMEEKLKNYSSGMQVRLAFSVAIQAKADILVLDEVLAVGDEAFQKKCYSYFDSLKRNKKTVILVTHDMAAVERFCNRVVLIDKGDIKTIGSPHKVAAEYSRRNTVDYDTLKNSQEESKNFKIELYNNDGKKSNKFSYLEEMTVKLSWKQKGVQHVGLAIFRENGEYVFGPNTYQDKVQLSNVDSAEYKVKLNLNEGRYFVKAGLMGKNDVSTISFIEEGPFFSVERDYDNGRWGGVTKLDHTWK